MKNNESLKIRIPNKHVNDQVTDYFFSNQKHESQVHQHHVRDGSSISPVTAIVSERARSFV